MDKVVLVTGATHGIGQATAELLTSHGWNVVLSGRNTAAGEKVAEGIRAKGGKALFITADVTNEEDVKNLHAKAIEAYGQLDAAVNNAGAYNDAGKLGDLRTQQFRDMLEVNVIGLFWCMKYQLQHMTQRKKGAIVNLASICGLYGVHDAGTYCATKHAVGQCSGYHEQVMGLTRAAALDYAEDGITVNAVAPGVVRTEILEEAFKAGTYTPESMANMLPMRRMGQPLDIARAIEFCLNSPAATGSCVSVDQGYGAGQRNTDKV